MQQNLFCKRAIIKNLFLSLKQKKSFECNTWLIILATLYYLILPYCTLSELSQFRLILIVLILIYSQIIEWTSHSLKIVSQ